MLFSKDAQNKFIKQIESIVEKENSYMDAVLFVCEENNIEPNFAAKYLTRPIIEKEGMEYNLLPKKSSKLPI
jgi:hypothetical protein